MKCQAVRHGGRTQPDISLWERLCQEWTESKLIFLFTRFSVRMMTNIKPVVLESSITKTIVEINAVNADERQKVKWLTEQQGNFLIPSKKELQFMSDTYNDEFSKELIKSLQ